MLHTVFLLFKWSKGCKTRLEKALQAGLLQSNDTLEYLADSQSGRLATCLVGCVRMQRTEPTLIAQRAAHPRTVVAT